MAELSPRALPRGAPAAPPPTPLDGARAAATARGKHTVWVDLMLLALGALAIRLPFQTTVLYHWDSVLYARALNQFDVSQSQPHPPGYLFYVLVARGAQVLLHDPNASLVAVSLAGGALAVALTYLAGRLLFGRLVGVLAALLLAVAPPFWYYSGVAYPYTVLAAGSAGLAVAGVAYWRGSWDRPVLLGWLYGVAGGFRLDLLIFLAPLLAAAHLVRWTARRDGRLLLAALVGAVLGVLLWLAPTAILSGGWSVYLPLLLKQGHYVERSYSLWARGWPALQSNGSQVLVYAWEGLQLALLPCLYGLGRVLWRAWRGAPRTGDWRGAPARVVLPLWLAPPVLFYTCVHIGDRGYSFSYLPALAVASAASTALLVHDLQRGLARWRGGLVRLRHWQYGGAALVGLLALLNAGTFLFGRGRLSAYEVDCVNRTTREAVTLIRQWFDPADTLLFSAFFYQHARYYLPEYRAWWYDPLTRPVFREPLPLDIRQVVIFGEGLWAARQPNVSYFPLACGRRLYYFYAVEPGAQVLYRPPLLSVRPGP
ncbi:MAG TPA: hypothetical protein VKZ60_08900 [Chloroflexota bacterium]|jgi:hypothetical protein|nr:hypothetical protein [Chloroflexota bacterium]